MIVPTSRPRVPTLDMGHGAVALRCAISTAARLSPCVVLQESKPGLGAHAQETVSRWGVELHGRDESKNAVLNLDLVYTNPHCVEVTGAHELFLKCVPY